VSVVIDTNTCVYLLGGRLARPLPDDDDVVSVITQIELLSYPLLTDDARLAQAPGIRFRQVRLMDG
jgi:hypothetical protein